MMLDGDIRIITQGTLSLTTNRQPQSKEVIEAKNLRLAHPLPDVDDDHASEIEQ